MLEWRLLLSLGLTLKAVLGEWFSSHRLGKAWLRGDALSKPVTTLCVDISYPSERAHSSHQTTHTSGAGSSRMAKPRVMDNGGAVL